MGQAVTAEARARSLDSVCPADVAHAAHAHWEVSYWPAIIGIGILFLAPLAFAFHFVYQMPLAAVLSLGVGAPMVVAGVVGWVREGYAHRGEGLGAPAMGWFIVAEALIFLSFFASYWVVRIGAPAWPPAATPALPTILPLFMTALLVTSSVTIHVAELRHEQGDHGGFVRWLTLTILLGLGFFACTAYEWSQLAQLGFVPATNVFSTMFYSITGFHAGHVLVGVAIFLAILLPALAGKTHSNFLTAGSMYWHFVDIVWLFVVSQVYFW
jgi:cytochrome c oxidase subunit 3